MVDVLAVVGLGNVSGMPEDEVQTTWCFKAASAAPATLDGIAASIVSFFNTSNPTPAQSVGFLISGVVSRAANACSVTFYDLTGHLDGSPHGSPIHTVPFTMDAAQAAQPLPSEVALRQTILADGWEDQPETMANPTPPPGIIRPRSRYRGGFYLGPWVDSGGVRTSDLALEPRPTSTLFTYLEEAWFRFMDERAADFAIWSRADEVLRLVAPGGLVLVDNAFDTQRRRGPDATARLQMWP